MKTNVQNVLSFFIANNCLCFVIKDETKLNEKENLNITIGKKKYSAVYIEKNYNLYFFQVDIEFGKPFSGELIIDGKKIRVEHQHFNKLGTIFSNGMYYNLTIKNNKLAIKKTQNTKVVNKILAFNIIQTCDKTSFFIPEIYNQELENYKLVYKKRKEQVYFDIDIKRDFSGNVSYQTNEIVDEKATFVRGDFFYVDKYNGSSRRLFWGDCLKQVKDTRYTSPVPLKSGKSISLYETKNHQMSFVVSDEEKIINESSDTYAELHRVKLSKDGRFLVSVNISGECNVEQIELLIKQRKIIDDKATIIILMPIKKQKNRYYFEVNLLNCNWKPLYWDCLVNLKTIEGKSITLKISNNSVINKINLQYFTSRNEITTEDNFLLFPYITADEKLSVAYREKGNYESKKYRTNEKIAYILSLLFGWFHKQQKIWIIHEKFSSSAQDNSFYFFKHCYENERRRNVYFVLDKTSSDRDYVKGMEDRVVDFMSIKHLYILIVSKLIISSEAKGHGYAWRVSKGVIRPIINQKEFVFLQHGVIGFKRVDGAFKANGMNHANLFVTSAEWEKKIVLEELGYAESEVIVTGLARWDEIHRNPPKKKQQILYMPTWRNWLEEVSDKEFVESDYYRAIISVIKSEKIQHALKRKNLEMIFYVHPKFNQFIELLVNQDGYIKVSNLEDNKLNKVLGESIAVITDYSSIAWEALYQNIPVLFYQFDLEEYMLQQGSYIDFNKVNFGRRISQETEISQAIIKFEQNNYSEISSNYFSDVDMRNSERILNAIDEYCCANRYKEKTMYKLKRNPIVRTMWRKLKKIRERVQ